MPAHILMHFTGNGIGYADLKPFVKKKECENIQITCFNEKMMFYGIQVPVDKCSCIIEFIDRAKMLLYLQQNKSSSKCFCQNKKDRKRLYNS